MTKKEWKSFSISPGRTSAIIEKSETNEVYEIEKNFGVVKPMDMAGPRRGKPYSQQLGRRHGKGRGKIVDNQYRGNQFPEKDSNWYDFAKRWDIGVLDLDAFARDVGFDDFKDLDISISPNELQKRDSRKFKVALLKNSLQAQKELEASSTGGEVSSQIKDNKLTDKEHKIIPNPESSEWRAGYRHGKGEDHVSPATKITELEGERILPANYMGQKPVSKFPKLVNSDANTEYRGNVSYRKAPKKLGIEKSRLYLRKKPVKYLRKEGNKYIYKNPKNIKDKVKTYIGAYKECIKLFDHLDKEGDRLSSIKYNLEDKINKMDLNGKVDKKKQKQYNKQIKILDEQLDYIEKLNDNVEKKSNKLYDAISKLETKLEDRMEELYTKEDIRGANEAQDLLVEVGKFLRH